MDTSLPSKSLSPIIFLSFTALAQIVLGLWVMDRMSITIACSILLGFFLFALLACAVRDVIADLVQERRAYGASRVYR